MAKHRVTPSGMRKQGLGVGGIDVAKDWHYVQWLDRNGRPVGKAFRFANTRAGFEAMGDRRPADAVRIGMESTGHSWLGLAHWLRAPGAEGVLVQPAHVHRLKELDDYKLDDNTPTKTDAKDARVIGRLVFDDRWFRWEPRAGALAQLATLAVTRPQHRQEVMRWRSRIAGWLHQYVPEFRTVFKACDRKAALTALDATPTPDLVLVQSVDALTDQFKAATKNRVGAKRANALHPVAADSIGIPGSPRVSNWPPIPGVGAQRAIEAEQAAILADFAPAKPLASIPEFGTQVIATALGELGNLSRFADPRQAQKMAGLNLTQSSSGHHQSQTHIAKRGRPAARAVLYQAACVAVAQDPQWKVWYQPLTRRAAHPLAPKAAMVAVATKLLRVAWACMKHGQAYDARRLFPTRGVTAA